MIKFFRQIRGSLINQNKIGKYFKYAIGEILLVVIGILIALQINNWNEKRKQQIRQHAMLTKFSQDLKEDYSNFQENIYEIEQIDSLHQSLFNIALKKSNIQLKNPVFIRRGLLINQVAKDNNPNITTNINDETIRHSSQDYFKDIYSTQDYVQEHYAIIIKIRDFLRKTGTIKFEEWAKNRTFKNIISSEGLVDLAQETFFQQLLFESSLKLQNCKESLNKAIKSNQDLALLIENYLNDDQ